MAETAASRLTYHIVAYRGMLHGATCSVAGRVIKRPLQQGSRSTDSWWANLLSSYRRFDSEPFAGFGVQVSYRGRSVVATADAEGYYELEMEVPAVEASELWETAEVMCSDGGPVFLQPVLCIPGTAAFGVISDIDDTVLESNVTRWQTAAELTFLHNAHTRRPLEGVAQLYQAMQNGRDGAGPNPIFYVSASPWNLYDLLEDFFDLNGVPQGPILLRDLDLDRQSFSAASGSRSKLQNMHLLIERYPALKWLLMGDSGQVDAELYAETVRKYPGRILAVYIRDIDPILDSPHDSFVDGHIVSIAGTGVPMLRVKDSNAIAEHLRTLGLIPAARVEKVADDVQRDQAKPGLAQAALAGVHETLSDASRPAGR